MQEWNQDWKLLESSGWVLVTTGLQTLDLDFSSLLKEIWKQEKFFFVSQSFSFLESAEFYWWLPQQSLGVWNSRIRKYHNNKKKKRKFEGTANQRIPPPILQDHSSSEKKEFKIFFHKIQDSESAFDINIWMTLIFTTYSNYIITFLILLKNTFLPYYLDLGKWFVEIFGVWACFWWHGL